jgi:glutathione synthase/RimK-type ligase-like ATP-grasp enzyme
VQERLGGTISPFVPPEKLVEDARDLLARHAPDCLYARVDVVETPDRFVLMEIELVEPSLFLERHAPAAMAFANAIKGRLKPDATALPT